MGPAALPAILSLQRLGFVASQPVAVWIGFLVASPIVSSACDARYRRVPTPAWLHARIAHHAAAVTIAIYLTGWGPALTGAFAFVALENVSHDGSGTWRVTALWSMLGIAVGQVAVWRGWAPSYLPLGQAEALGVLGAFVLVFVIRMAGATSQQKEEAEASLRTNEERFRSLVQNSSDTTLVINERRRITYASPGTGSLLGKPPEAVVGRRDLEFVHPEDKELVEAQLASRLQSADVSEPIQFRMKHSDEANRGLEARACGGVRLGCRPRQDLLYGEGRLRLGR
jgi:PAS domain S-box-containing protein